MPETRFSYKAFEKLLQAVQGAGYAFGRFDRPGAARRAFFLRFDVDISPLSALHMGRMVHQRSVVANFFFQLNADTYNLFARHNLSAVEELRALGHCVGLHVDQQILGEEEMTLSRTLDWFGSCVLEIDDVISFHRPSKGVLGRRYERLTSAYDPRFFSPERYLSDSRRSLAFWPVLEEWLGQGRTPLQLLLHPVWWNSRDSAQAILQALRARRLRELDRYLLENFNKVFASVIEPDQSVDDL